MYPGFVTAMGGKPLGVLHLGRGTGISSFLEASLTLLRKVLPSQRPPPKPVLPINIFYKWNSVNHSI